MSREILFREAVIGFMSGGKIQPDLGFGGGAGTTSGKGIGHHCRGADVPECRSYFGEELSQICKTCPQ